MTNALKKYRWMNIQNNKSLRYLLYMAGEIVLVVIGILIALQIYSWRDHKKAQQQQVEILQEMTIQLEADLIDLNACLQILIKNKENYTTIGNMDPLKTAKNQDSIGNFAEIFIGSRVVFWQHTSVYSNLKTIGLQHIENQNLSSQIAYYYDYIKSNLTTLDNFRMSITTQKEVYISDFCKYNPSNRSFNINNVYNILTDGKFNFLLKRGLDLNSLSVDAYTIAIDHVEELKTEISNEVMRLNENL